MTATKSGKDSKVGSHPLPGVGTLNIQGKQVPYKHSVRTFRAAKPASITTMDNKYPIQASTFLTDGTISLDDIRMSLESTPEEDSQSFDMTSYLNYEVLQFLRWNLVQLR